MIVVPHMRLPPTKINVLADGAVAGKLKYMTSYPPNVRYIVDP
jgi:hypothetical protein